METREDDDYVTADQDTTLTQEAKPSSPTPVQDHSIPSQELVESNEGVLGDDILEILGIDPTATTEYGNEVHKEIATRFNHVATAGLTKDVRKELCEKYLIPSNCTRISAPLLNIEIKAAFNEPLLKRDQAIEARQKELASAISCLAQVATDQLTSKNTNHELLKKVMDAGRLLCDIQHSQSVTRRNFAVFSLKKEMKEHLGNTTIDKYLFGENLPDALKTAKAVSKSGTELKQEEKPLKKTRPATTSLKPRVTKNLNWRTPAPVNRRSGPSRSQEPVPQRSQPRTSLKQSSYQQETTRRR